MKKKTKTFLLIVMVISIVLLALLFKTLLEPNKQEAIKVSFVDEYVDLYDYIGKKVSLLVKNEHSTGVAYQTYALEVDTNEYAYLRPISEMDDISRERGPALQLKEDSVPGPNASLDQELTLYSDNTYIMRGTLSLEDLFAPNGENEGKFWHIDVDNWDIVYPVSATMRLPCFKGYLYSFDWK